MEELPAEKEKYRDDICRFNASSRHDFMLLAEFRCIHGERLNI
jgi:hypothetical protein